MNPSFSLNLVDDVNQLFSFPFMVNALLAGTIVAVLAATVGWYMVLRRQTFAGHTLAVMAFPGATGAALAGLPTTLGYYLACGGAALVMGRANPQHSTRGAQTAVIGTVQTVGLAAGYLFLSLNHAVLGGPESLLFGTVLGITRAQVMVLLGVALVAVALLALIARPLLLATIDPEAASARGVPVRALDVAFLLILGVTVAASTQITGVLLVFALLVAPAASAQTLTMRPVRGLALSIALAMLITWLGLGVAYFSIYPVGFYITTFATSAYVLSLAASRLARARTARTS
jgi:zinc/manganese transport system permease protein